MRFITILLVFLVGSWRLFGQPPALSVKYFDKSDGLTNSNINFVAQDSTGFIWVATLDGLFKYDGYRFTVYRHIRDDSTSLTGNTVNYLFADNKNRLWVSTSAGLCWYNREKDNFVYVAGRRDVNPLASYDFKRITTDAEGNILTRNQNQIFRYNEKSKILEQVFESGDAGINDFMIDNKNRLWISLSSNKGLVKTTIGKTGRDTILKNINIASLAMQDNELWMACMGGGIQKMDISSNKVIRFPFKSYDESLALFITIDQHHRIWTIDYTGLKIFQPEYGDFLGYYPVSGDETSIKSNVYGIFPDRQGNYWIYHRPGGLGISMNLKGFQHYDNNLNKSWHTSNPKVNAVNEETNGNLWMGYHEGGVDVFDWSADKIRSYKHHDNDKKSIGKGSVNCIFRDSQGTMWIGSYNGGLQRYEKDKDNFTSFMNDPLNPSSPAGNDIRSIDEDQEGNLWLAVHGKGVDKFDRKNNRFIHFNNADNQLSNDWPFSIVVDHNDNIWVATAWGLNLLKKGEQKFQNYLSSVKDTTTLTSELVTSVYEDDQHIIWAGTSNGLNRYNAGSNNFTRFQGLFENDYVTGITSTDSTIWVCTLSGISSLTSGNEVHNFNTSDGLQSSEFSFQKVYRNNTNQLYFGGMHGIDMFNPYRIKLNTIPPAVVITGIQVYNKFLTPFNTDELKKQITYTSKIRLKYTDKVISFTFAALNFINPEENMYAYRMKGFENTWHTGISRYATYTNLDPGKYTLQVRACNNDGIWNTVGTELELMIMPPWYRTVWFRIFLVLAIFGAVLLYVSKRTANLHKQRVLLEKAVKEKTAELNLQADHLLEVNKELQRYNNTKDRLFSLISHDLVSPFNTIIGFSEVLKENYNQLTEKEKITYIRMIHESSRKVFLLLNNLLVWSRSQTNQIKCNPEMVKLQSIIQEVVELNKEPLNVKNIKANVGCDDDLAVIADIEMLKTIVRNLFNNALKFSFRDGTISITATPNHKSVSVSFIDSGPGMNQDKIDEILSETIIHSEYGTNGETGTGLGLSLCKEFIKTNKGEFFILSEPGKGSTFTFTLPSA
ncbi:MAG TPA: two-component regulator propeller domain-containing protein [Bacteroidales bacterium]|nr:two-component regulator propeller domain-containing protein [Bacteroidales bacterium]